MTREVLTLNVGQCGIQLGQQIWNEYCYEHHIDAHGNRSSNTNNDDPRCFFEQTSEGKYVPRNLMIDTEPNVIDDVRSPLFDDDFLLCGKQDAANNFARGHYTVGKEMMDTITDRLRKLVDGCDNLQGFVMNHSVGGGTGSGLASLILERIAVDYRKKSKFGVEIYPSPLISTSVVEPYNALLATHWLLDHTETSIVYDNEAMYEICQFALNIKAPSYDDVNQLVAQTVSSITTGLRFTDSESNVDLNEFQTNLVPFPRLHFMYSSMSPLATTQQRRALPTTERSVTMIGNNTVMSRFFSDRITKKYDLMYSQRAFVHWFVREGMEEGEFAEAREDIGFLEKDYLDVLSEQATDEEDSDEDELYVQTSPTTTMDPRNSSSHRYRSTQRGLPYSNTSKRDIQSLSCACFEAQNFFVKCPDFDAEEDKYMAISVNYRGNVKAKEANASVQWLKTNKKVTFVEWCPTGFKVAIAGDDDDTIGFAVGGARDVNNFRELVNHNVIPPAASVTYNGLLYEYYFDTKTTKQVKQEKKENEDEGDPLFYPSYCFAKIQKTDFIDIESKSNDNDFEYFVSVGLNSNLKQSEFRRKHLNIVIVLDQSGSMGWRFNNGPSYQTKMQIANEAVITLMDHLGDDDRFGLLVFDSEATVIQPLQLVKNIDLETLKRKILSIKERGGTNFEAGYRAAIGLYDNAQLDGNMKYDNRIVYLTDAQPNGYTTKDSLLGMTQKYANDELRYIYTTFIGIGLDFNASLIETISNCRGCNYYSVQSAEDFAKKMNEDFEFMVTPLVFNVVLRLKCEGDVCTMDKVYGANEKKAEKILENGEITRINTLFPSLKSKKKGGTKGGIQLIKLNKNALCEEDKMNVSVVVTFEDRYGKKYRNDQLVMFKPPKIMNDMIAYDHQDNFYDNLGIRKGILLCKYVEVLHSWSKSQQPQNAQQYKQIFKRFLVHFETEMRECKDETLQKEVQILQKLANEDFVRNRF